MGTFTWLLSARMVKVICPVASSMVTLLNRELALATACVPSAIWLLPSLFQVLPLSIEISQKPFASTFSFGVTPAVPASGMALTGLSLTSSSVVMSLMVYAQ